MNNIKPTSQSLRDTSFHDVTIRTTVKDLTQAIGEPVYACNDGDDKSNYEWEAETADGIVFSVYDWKEYRRLKDTERISFHIGTHTPEQSWKVYDAIIKALN